MLNDFITSATRRYHDLGHISPAVDRMMDMGGGFGHRVQFGHDLDGFLRAYDLDGMDGMRGWIDHMLKDFTTPAGVPLPFADALVNLTPLEMSDAVDWLCVNAADFVELGAGAATVEFIEKRFAGNRAAYHTALAAGMALGFADDNPLLIAFSGAKWLINAKNNVARLSPEMNDRIDRSLALAMRRFETVSYYALGEYGASHALDLVDIPHAVKDALDGIPVVGGGGDIVDGLMGIWDGLATLGLVFGARRMVREAFGWLNGVRDREIARLAEKAAPRRQLAELLERGVPPAALVGPLSQTQALPAPAKGE